LDDIVALGMTAILVLDHCHPNFCRTQQAFQTDSQGIMTEPFDLKH